MAEPLFLNVPGWPIKVAVDSAVAVRAADDPSESLGRLVMILAQKGVLTAPEAAYIARIDGSGAATFVGEVKGAGESHKATLQSLIYGIDARRDNLALDEDAPITITLDAADVAALRYALEKLS